MSKRKRVTSQDIADLCGVSRTTVSLVLNDVPNVRISEETRRRVLEAARRLNYHPDAVARKLVSGRSHTIAVVLRHHPHPGSEDAFLPEVLRGIGAVAQRHHYHILYQPLDPTDPTTYGDLVRENHADGIILSGPRADDKELVKAHQDGVPIVLLGQIPGIDIPFVDVDNVKAAKMAVDHLLALGHRRMAMITNASLNYTASRARLMGYQQALEAAGLPYDEELVRHGDFTAASGAKAMAELLQLSPLPTAIFVASDVVACGALQEIKRHGLRVPEDIALVSFDDIPLARYLDPPLTTVRLPAHEEGRQAAGMLIALIEGKKLHEPCVLMETELIVRESCGSSAMRRNEKRLRT